MLDRVLLQMVQLARRGRHYEIKMEKWQREREEEERIGKIREAEIKAEKQRRKALRRAAESWKQSGHLREFVHALEGRLAESNPEHHEILQWARSIADGMDPLRRSSDELVDLLGKKSIPSTDSEEAFTNP